MRVNYAKIKKGILTKIITQNKEEGVNYTAAARLGPSDTSTP